jgi:DNA-binding LacI/PurR family transcriptional regulator
MTTPAKPPTIREVAARAGVSTATVSRALRGGASVDPRTRQRVEEAARALRYRPSGVARSLKLRATSTIGLIVTDITNPYFPQIVGAVEDAARVRGYSVLLADGRGDPEREIESLENLAVREVDGLIIASSALSDRHRDRIRDAPCPVVIMNSASSVAAVPAVLSDNEGGGRLIARHVVSLGHRRLAYITAPPPKNAAVRERLAGVRAHLAEEGLGDPIRVVHGDGGVDGADRSARQALRDDPGTTALLCYNDLTAVGAIRGLRAIGLRVPADVSVVGFDDIDIAPCVDPALTTVHQAADEMGRWALSSLCARIDHGREPSAGTIGGPPGETRRVPVRLVERESTGPARDRPVAP